ncbi:MAG: hypothetical protein U0J65_05685 [Christensenellales bacterium]|nr:hypothetical protein [Christensenellales bacterium]
MATLNKVRPSALLGIDDPYAAWCLDEACLFMVNKAREDKKEPDFDRPKRLEKQKQKATTNAAACEMLRALGVKVER